MSLGPDDVILRPVLLLLGALAVVLGLILIENGHIVQGAVVGLVGAAYVGVTALEYFEKS